jgi:nucleoside-diphosphate-sugar epimerase
VVDLANKINALTKNKTGVSKVPRRSWDNVLHRVASIEKARRLLGYEPKVGLDEGLKLTYGWFKSLEEYE